MPAASREKYRFNPGRRSTTPSPTSRTTRSASQQLDLAEFQPEAADEFFLEFQRRKRDQALGLAAFFRPYDRRAPSGERQDREASRRKKMLFGAALMIALMTDGGDDAGLAVAPGYGANASRYAR